MIYPHDNRKLPRVEIILKVEYESSRDLLADYTHNASNGGLFINTSRSFALGEILTFELSFPGLLSPLRCKAEVIWRKIPEEADEVNPCGIGIAFIFDSAEQADRINKIIENLSGKAKTSTEQPQNAKPFRVLLAEDNHMVREMFRFAVHRFHRSKLHSRCELDILEAEDGKKAWRHVLSGALDLAIVDYYMPVMDGGQLVRKIREHSDSRTLPVIVVSVGGEDARRKAYAAGADLYLNKPVLMGQLFESLQKLLNI